VMILNPTTLFARIHSVTSAEQTPQVSTPNSLRRAMRETARIRSKRTLWRMDLLIGAPPTGLHESEGRFSDGQIQRDDGVHALDTSARTRPLATTGGDRAVAASDGRSIGHPLCATNLICPL